MLPLRRLINPLHFLHFCKYSSRAHPDDKGRKYLQNALDSYEDIRFMPLRLRGWQLRGSFSKAQIDVVQYLRDDRGVREPFTVSKEEFISGRVKTHVVPFRSIFYDGFEALQKSLDGKTDLLDVDLAANAFVTGFLNDKDYHEKCLQNVLDNDQENEVSVILANHLFSRLTASQCMTYYVTNDTKDKWHECPCALRCGDKIIYDNTGFGSEQLWHGKPDIMVFPMGGVSCSIIVPKIQSDDQDFFHEEELVVDISKDKQVIEVKGSASSLREVDNVKQITALAITFSLYQKRYQMKPSFRTSSVVSLIPVIAASGEFFDIYMYDSENDILLRNTGSPIPLWTESYEDPSFSKLNLSSILQLWMVINHISVRPFLNKQDTNMLTASCGFTSKLSKDLLHKIEATVKMKKKFRPFREQEFNYEMLKLPKSKVPPTTNQLIDNGEKKKLT